MAMVGIIMAGGLGTRLRPLTNIINKHLLPVFNKPMIFYPLTTLMLAGIRKIVIIAAPDAIPKFKDLLKDGSQLGIEINYIEESKPAGIAQGILLAKHIIKKEKICLILGDNIFHGIGLGRQLAQFLNPTGAQIFAYQVRDPENYGVIEIASDGQILSLEEKPQSPKSNFAVPGIYFYDNSVIEFVRDLAPSARGELEITDLNSVYLKLGKLNVCTLSKGIAWLDVGTFTGLLDASTYIRIIEERQNFLIGDPYQAAFTQGWITGT